MARSQPDIMEILEELGLETYPQFITGEKVMQVGRGNKIRRYKSDIPSIGSFWGLIELQLFIWKVLYQMEILLRALTNRTTGGKTCEENTNRGSVQVAIGSAV